MGRREPMLPAPCPQMRARRGWGHPPAGALQPRPICCPCSACEEGMGWGCVPSLQQTRRSNRSVCVGGKTYIQIYVYDHHQTSPLPLLRLHVRLLQSPRWGLAAKGCGCPSSSPHAGLSGCLWAGNSCVSCWSGTGWHSSVLVRVLLPG